MVVNGVDFGKRDLEKKEVAQMALGFAASFGAHWASHVVYLESKNTEWHQDGLSEVVDGDLVGGENAAFGRAGFVGQLSVGVLLNIFRPDSYFTKGYDIGTFTEIATYPISPKRGDLECIRDGDGDARLEWAGYTGLSTFLLLK